MTSPEFVLAVVDSAAWPIAVFMIIHILLKASEKRK